MGPGAHGRVSVDGVLHGTAQRRGPDAWLSSVERSGHGTEVSEALSAADRAAECLIMGLRTLKGVSCAHFENVTGRSLDDGVRPGVLADFLRDGLLVRAEGSLRATRRGRTVLDSLLAELIAD